jgi:hypothetical protein
MLIHVGRRAPANHLQVAREVSTILERRGAMTHPPVSLAISNAVALGIVELFRSSTPSGRVMDRFFVSRSADSDALIDAARFEQGYASPEGHAALHCLIGWVRHRAAQAAQLSEQLIDDHDPRSSTRLPGR